MKKNATLTRYSNILSVVGLCLLVGGLIIIDK